MATPLFVPKTVGELQVERDALEKSMLPYTVDVLRRLREENALDFNEERKLDRYESLSWLIDG
ncbi:hypothetical protein [Corynebacterium sanguinis]|uniref:hypothetical protein n=1 Tax=Corynebacterium sanguinis TaxID=2594913 RepID=UPI0010AAD3A4|nr:hypothetical protein [Corynebacterium sanguinis]MDN8576340.1 hypothetical protein [Corynebacterium sanguinis]